MAKLWLGCCGLSVFQGFTLQRQCRILLGVCLLATLVLLVSWHCAIPPFDPGFSQPKSYLAEPGCVQPRTHFAFLKVHKSGSSTVINILQRFVWSRDLNVALPNKPLHVGLYNYIGTNRSYGLADVIPLPPGETYSALFNHVDGYNRSAFQEILPPDAYYFAIVRRPLRRFISASVYYDYLLKNKFPSATNNSNGGRAAFLIAHRDDPTFTNLRGYKYFYNGLANDFGIPMGDQNNDTAMASHLQSLGKDFGFVLILEEFDLSLLLLRRRLCWGFKDILYQVHNARWDDNPVRLSPEVRSAYAQWQRADMMIYDFFHKRFTRLVTQEGEDLWLELRHFREVLETVTDYCSAFSAGKKLNGTQLTIGSNPWSEGFTLTPEDCHLISLEELAFHDMMVNASLARVAAAKKLPS